MRSRLRRARVVPCRGLSLLECLVGLALGLVIVATVAAQYVATGQSARLQAAQSQMAEDAQIALQLLSSELMMAGYARPQTLVQGTDGKPRWQTALQSEPPLRACDAGFVSPASTTEALCAGSGGTAAFEVRYQADEFNTVPLSGSTRPSDCLGNGLNASASGYFTTNRWYVAISQGRSELRCASQLGNPGQPLVDNVEALALWFAEAQSSEAEPPARYVRASQVISFARVRSVRLCLLMRSTDAVLAAEEATTYLDCEGVTQTAVDRRLRRAFHTTVALRNRSGA